MESLHIMGFALSVGTIAIVDLRLLGLGIRTRTAAELATDLGQLSWLGITLMLLSGSLMFSADAVIWRHNPTLWTAVLAGGRMIAFT